MDDLLKRMTAMEAQMKELKNMQGDLVKQVESLKSSDAATQAKQQELSQRTQDFGLKLDTLRMLFHDPAGPRVVDTVEVLEMILLYLFPADEQSRRHEDTDEEDDGMDEKNENDEQGLDEYGRTICHLLTAVQLTSKQFKGLIDGSIKLQRAMFFAPDPGCKPRRLNYLIDAFECLLDTIFVEDAETSKLKLLTRGDLPQLDEPLHYVRGLNSTPVDCLKSDNEWDGYDPTKFRLRLERAVMWFSCEEHRQSCLRLGSRDFRAGSWQRMYLTQPPLPLVRTIRYENGQKNDLVAAIAFASAVAIAFIRQQASIQHFSQLLGEFQSSKSQDKKQIEDLTAKVQDLASKLHKLRIPFNDPASRRLVKIPEILEHILLSVEDEYGEHGPDVVRFLLHAQRVTKQFESVIDGSVRIQRALFLAPDPTEKRARINTYLLEDVGVMRVAYFLDNTHVPPRLVRFHPRMLDEGRPLNIIGDLDAYMEHHVDGTLSGLDFTVTPSRSGSVNHSIAERYYERLRGEACWKRMYLTQPPVPVTWSASLATGDIGGVLSRSGKINEVLGGAEDVCVAERGQQWLKSMA